MIRLLFIVPTLMPGGTEKQISLLARGLAANKKYYTEIVSLYKKGRIESEFSETNIKVSCIGMKNIYDLFGALRLIGFIKRGKFDIVHNFLFDANFWGGIAGFFSGKKIIVSSRRDIDVWKRRKHIILERIGNLFSKKVIVNAHAIKDFVIRQERLNPDKIEVIYNGIEIDKFSNDKDKAYYKKEILGFQENVRIVTMIGTLSVKKSQTDFLKAAQKVLQIHNSNVKFLIVGAGPLEVYLKQLTYNLGIADYVFFSGFRDDISSILAATDIFVLPSLFEGLPNVILEAMASGLPVVATDVGGIPEVVENGKSGILIKPKDYPGLADTILDLLEKEDLRITMGRRGREIVEEKFNFERMLRDYDNLYLGLLKDKGNLSINCYRNYIL